MKKILLVIFLISTADIIIAQQLPVIRALSNSVDVKDGDNFKKGYWYITPEKKIDTFFVERFKGNKKVSFYTDIDSISFAVALGETHDFIIVLNNKDSAYTRVYAGLPVKVSYQRKCADCITDTIPFTLGWNNLIHMKGCINNSDMLDLIFDTGANGVVLSDDAYSKNVKVKIDGSIEGHGIGGSSQDELSKSNNLNIAGISWNNVALSVKHAGKPNADGVIGYNVFDGNIVEINYDKKVLVIHQSLPSQAKKYSRYDLTFKDGLSHIKLILNNDRKKTEGLFNFDTGSSETLFVNNEFASANELYNSMKKVGSDKLKGGGSNKIVVEKLLLPSLLIGGYELKDIRIGVEDASANDGPSFNIVGNDILKRFNAIIDYQNDVVYLRQNTLVNNLYLNEKITYVLWIGGVFVLFLSLSTFAFYKKRKIKTFV